MQDDLRLSIRNIEKTDYPGVKQLMDLVYSDIGGAWPEHTIDKLINEFHDGQICLIDHDQVVGIALAVRVDYVRFSNPHTYDDLISQRETILDDPEGDALYGLDVLIHPDYRGYRLGRRLYEARKELCRQRNLRSILAGGRIPNYHQHSDDYTPTEYIDAVRRREIYDPILTFQLANNFQVKRLLKQYLPEDEKSEGYATLLEWNNILYDSSKTVLTSRKQQVRIGAVQWQMREVESVEELLTQVEYFVDALAEYKSDFAVFPEFFNAPLMALSDDQRDQPEAIRFVAGFTERFRNEMSRMAITHNINVITGSLPLIEGENLYNVSYLCHRNGTVSEQRKIHITPHERRDWVIQGGMICVFSRRMLGAWAFLSAMTLSFRNWAVCWRNRIWIFCLCLSGPIPRMVICECVTAPRREPLKMSVTRLSAVAAETCRRLKILMCSTRSLRCFHPRIFPIRMMR